MASIQRELSEETVERDAVEVAEPRLTIRGVIREVLATFSLERGILRTALDLTLRPHKVIRTYLAAPRRSGYTNVWSYFFLASGLMVFVEAIFPRPPFPTPIADLGELLIQYRAATLALSLPIAALATRLLFRRWLLNYAEHLVLAAFVTAQVQVFWLVLHPLGQAGLPPAVAAAGLTAVTFFPAVVVFLFDEAGGRWRALRALAVAVAYMIGQGLTTGVVMALFILFGWVTFAGLGTS